MAKIQIIGNVGRDPELKMTPNGRPVCEFTVAVNRVTGKRDSGERNEQTDWYRVSCWGNLAETAQQIVQRGRLVFVDGRFSARAWTDKEGRERTSLEISANDFQVLDSRRDREGAVGAPEKVADGEKGFDPDEIPF
jgi:single-strand DNA-binding protein